jgi:hypothetical protein
VPRDPQQLFRPQMHLQLPPRQQNITSILVVGVAPLSTLYSINAGPVLIALIILIHVQLVTGSALGGPM